MGYGFHQHTTGDEVVHTLSSRSDGKTYIITGCSPTSILGATALSLAKGNPRCLILTGRSSSKLEPLLKSIREINPNIKTLFVQLDLSDLDSVRSAAKEVLYGGKNGEIKEEVKQVHGLINGAGVMCTPWGKTKQEVETQFGTNHLGHFLWTNLLLPRVIAAGPRARIVTVASTGFILGDVQMDNYNWDDGKTYHPWLAYAASKTANVLFSTYLASHLACKGIEAIALQPGMPQTPLYNHVSEDGITSIAEAGRLWQAKHGDAPMPSGKMEEDEKTIETAASTVLSAALSDEWDGKGGLFLRNCQVFEPVPYSVDPKRAEELWALSERLVGEKFVI